MKYFLIILLTVNFLWAQPRSFDRERPARGMGRMEAILDLNEDQQKKVDELKSEMQKKQIDLQAKVKAMRIEIRDLYGQENPDRNAIEAKLNQISKFRNEIQLNRMDFWFGVNELLTADQQKIWKKQDERKDMRLGRGHNMRGFRGSEFARRDYNFRRGSSNKCDTECPCHR